MAWAGPPYALDLATMSGQLALTVIVGLLTSGNWLTPMPFVPEEQHEIRVPQAGNVLRRDLEVVRLTGAELTEGDLDAIAAGFRGAFGSGVASPSRRPRP